MNFKKYLPTATSLITSGGVLATAYFAAVGGAKAKTAIDKAEKGSYRKTTLADKIRLTWKYFIPAAVCGSITLTGIGANAWMTKKIQANLVGAYVALDQTYKKYQNEVKELCGEDTHVKILRDMGIKESEDPKVSASCFDYSNCGGPFDVQEELRTFYDTYSEQYFKATIGQVMRAELHINRNVALMGEVPLAMWYEFLGIDPPEDADRKYWSLDDWAQFIDFNHYTVNTDDGFECCVIEFAVDPIPLDTL